MKQRNVIEVEIRERDGLFCATSEQMPGFFLCSKNQSALEADILPAMKQLLTIKQQHQKKVPAARSAERLVARRELAFA